jgi:hypothetical protein
VCVHRLAPAVPKEELSHQYIESLIFQNVLQEKSFIFQNLQQRKHSYIKICNRGVHNEIFQLPTMKYFSYQLYGRKISKTNFMRKKLPCHWCVINVSLVVPYEEEDTCMSYEEEDTCMCDARTCACMCRMRRRIHVCRMRRRIHVCAMQGHVHVCIMRRYWCVINVSLVTLLLPDMLTSVEYSKRYSRSCPWIRNTNSLLCPSCREPWSVRIWTCAYNVRGGGGRRRRYPNTHEHHPLHVIWGGG